MRGRISVDTGTPGFESLVAEPQDVADAGYFRPSSRMRITVEEAERLADESLRKIGYSAEDTAVIAHHLIDSELRGYAYAGLARMLSIADRLEGKPPACRVDVTREAPATAQLKGNDSLGYLVAHKATKIAIEKAKQVGVAVVGANETWYTGVLCYYAEMAAANNLVTVVASNCSAWVAPEGGYKPMFGTNPFCIGFPSSGTPVIYDIGTSKIMHATAVLAGRVGEELDEGVAFSRTGEPTRDPAEALKGALAVAGGHKGSGLAIAVQLLGVLAGSPAFPPDLHEFGFLIIAVNPAMFRPLGEFKKEIDDYAATMRASPPLPGRPEPLRMPFERSTAQRQRTRKAGELEVEDTVVEGLRKRK